jgi:ribosomal protein S18 acetylase RimI-like enzyme
VRILSATVRNTTLRDIPGIVKIANQAFVEMARRTSHIGLGVLEWLIRQPDYQFVAVDGEAIVGFLVGSVRGEEEEAVVHWIGIHPSHQRRGIGSMLMFAFENAAIGKARKAVTGTPFAKGFYEKLGYKCIHIEHRLVKELMSKPITKGDVKFETIDIDNLGPIISFLREEAPKFLEAFFGAYEDDSDKLLSATLNEKPVGVITAKTNMWTRDLIEITYLHGVGLQVTNAVLEAFEAKCSNKGVRWVGVYTDDQKLMALLVKDGWVDAKLPMFWTRYHMEKNLISS